MEKAFVYCWL